MLERVKSRFSGWLKYFQTNVDQEERQLPTQETFPAQNRTSVHWYDKIKSITVFNHQRTAAGSVTGPLGISDFRGTSSWLTLFLSRWSTQVPSPSNQTLHSVDAIRLESVGIEAELDRDSFWVFHETPKRIKSRLVRDAHCNAPPAGWGLWVEEGFMMPGYLLVLVNLIPGIFLAIAVSLSIHHGLTWLSMASYALSVTTFVFSQWVLKAKDSRV